MDKISDHPKFKAARLVPSVAKDISYNGPRYSADPVHEAEQIAMHMIASVVDIHNLRHGPVSTVNIATSTLIHIFLELRISVEEFGAICEEMREHYARSLAEIQGDTGGGPAPDPAS